MSSAVPAQAPVQTQETAPAPQPVPQKLPIISTRSLSKWYGDVIGLNNFNVDVWEGITGIVGPNGAGKSTLFKLITGLIHTNAGDLYVNGANPWRNTEQLRNIGFCPDYEFLPLNMTGREYLNFLGGLHAMEKEHLGKKITEVSGIVGMTKNMDRPMSGFSKGMKQRLKIAGALLHSPKMLLLDEPLAGLDPIARRDIINLIKDLNTRYGHNVIVSSHVLHEIEKMTHNVVLIYKGRAVAQGDISEIRGLIDKHPHNIVLAGSNMTLLAKKLLDMNYTVSVGYNESRESITVRVTQPDEFFDSMPSLLEGTGCKIERMFSLDDNLESIFKYLVGW